MSDVNNYINFKLPYRFSCGWWVIRYALGEVNSVTNLEWVNSRIDWFCDLVQKEKNYGSTSFEKIRFLSRRVRISHYILYNIILKFKKKGKTENSPDFMDIEKLKKRKRTDQNIGEQFLVSVQLINERNLIFFQETTKKKKLNSDSESTDIDMEM